MDIFITNLSENMNRSKYHNQYSNQIRKIVAGVFGLDEPNMYEFLRMNLLGGFSSIPILQLYNNGQILIKGFLFNKVSRFLRILFSITKDEFTG